MRLLHPVLRDLAPEDLYDLYAEPGPHLRAGFVTSVDGVVAVDGRSGGLGSPADKAVFRALRATCDAIVVGAGTLRTEDYGPVRFTPEAAAWRTTHGYAPEVPVVVVTRTGDLGSGRVRQGPALVTGVDVPADLPSLVADLHARGLTRLLCEGGPHLLSDLLAAGLVDELCLTTSPAIIGEGPHLATTGAALQLTSVIHADPGVLLSRWSVVRSSDD